MKLRSALLAATAMLALPLAAANAQVTGPYISLGGGGNFMQQEPITSAGSMTLGNTNLHFDAGAAGVVAGGYGFGNGIRAELEFDYRYNSLNKVTGAGASASLNGNEQKFGPMVNVLYDFYDFAAITPMFVPYAGLGLGYQWADERVTGAGGFRTNFDKTAGAFAYQAILGAAIPISAVPGLSVTGEYRFLGLAGDRTYRATGGSLRLGNDLNHSVLVGLRYEFGVPPPPAQMPVADMGAKTFLVFFDWDKYNLTARSEAIVRDAAAYSTRSPYTRIDVDGNTDTSGTPQYNQGLSERRARRVADELVRDGVPQNVISMHAYGDTHLLVPTGPNVREPQNRRVEIVFH
jgi:OOP family OmpA-OmpF porin